MFFSHSKLKYCWIDLNIKMEWSTMYWQCHKTFYDLRFSMRSLSRRCRKMITASLWLMPSATISAHVWDYLKFISISREFAAILWFSWGFILHRASLYWRLTFLFLLSFHIIRKTSNLSGPPCWIWNSIVLLV